MIEMSGILYENVRLLKTFIDAYSKLSGYQIDKCVYRSCYVMLRKQLYVVSSLNSIVSLSLHQKEMILVCLSTVDTRTECMYTI